MYAATCSPHLTPGGVGGRGTPQASPDSLEVLGGCVVKTYSLSRYATEQLAAMGVDHVAELTQASVTHELVAADRATLRELLATGPLHPVRAAKIAIMSLPEWTRS